MAKKLTEFIINTIKYILFHIQVCMSIYVYVKHLCSTGQDFWFLVLQCSYPLLRKKKKRKRKHGSSPAGVSRPCSRGPQLQVYECDTTTHTHSHSTCAATACSTSSGACRYMQTWHGIQWKLQGFIDTQKDIGGEKRGDAWCFFCTQTHTGTVARQFCVKRRLNQHDPWESSK